MPQRGLGPVPHQAKLAPTIFDQENQYVSRQCVVEFICIHGTPVLIMCNVYAGSTPYWSTWLLSIQKLFEHVANRLCADDEYWLSPLVCKTLSGSTVSLCKRDCEPTWYVITHDHTAKVETCSAVYTVLRRVLYCLRVHLSSVVPFIIPKRGRVARTGDVRNARKILVRKYEWRRLLERRMRSNGRLKCCWHRQHSHSWLRVSSRSMTKILVLP
jgi:hypothetical protein